MNIETHKCPDGESHEKDAGVYREIVEVGGREYKSNWRIYLRGTSCDISFCPFCGEEFLE